MSVEERKMPTIDDVRLAVLGTIGSSGFDAGDLLVAALQEVNRPSNLGADLLAIVQGTHDSFVKLAGKGRPEVDEFCEYLHDATRTSR